MTALRAHQTNLSDTATLVRNLGAMACYERFLQQYTSTGDTPELGFALDDPEGDVILKVETTPSLPYQVAFDLRDSAPALPPHTRVHLSLTNRGSTPLHFYLYCLIPSKFGVERLGTDIPTEVLPMDTRRFVWKQEPERYPCCLKVIVSHSLLDQPSFPCGQWRPTRDATRQILTPDPLAQGGNSWLVQYLTIYPKG